MTTYVCGFAFNSNLKKVLVIQKAAGLESLVGKLNGIGDRVLLGEGFRTAVSRVLHAKAGIAVPCDQWHGFHTLRLPNGNAVHFFATRLSDPEFNSASTGSPEEIVYWHYTDFLVRRSLEELLGEAISPAVGDLAYLLPMAIESFDPAQRNLGY